MAMHKTINGKRVIITNPREVNKGYYQFCIMTGRGLGRVLEIPIDEFETRSFKYCGDTFNG